jgi:hypothetical protein
LKRKSPSQTHRLGRLRGSQVIRLACDAGSGSPDLSDGQAAEGLPRLFIPVTVDNINSPSSSPPSVTPLLWRSARNALLVGWCHCRPGTSLRAFHLSRGRRRGTDVGSVADDVARGLIVMGQKPAIAIRTAVEIYGARWAWGDNRRDAYVGATFNRRSDSYHAIPYHPIEVCARLLGHAYVTLNTRR